MYNILLQHEPSSLMSTLGKCSEPESDQSFFPAMPSISQPRLPGCKGDVALHPLAEIATGENEKVPGADDPMKVASALNLAELISELLRGSPRRFKEIYPLLAAHQRQNGSAASRNGKRLVSTANMGWLHEIERILQDIAVIREGIWYLKEESLPECSTERNTKTQADRSLPFERGGKIANRQRETEPAQSHCKGREPDEWPHTPPPDRLGSPSDNGETGKADVKVPKFKELIGELLRQSPMKFKELYPIIAERHTQHCPTHGNKVSLASMGWLREIQRELQGIAVNRDGLWYLKEEIPSVAPILGIEDSGEPAKKARSEDIGGSKPNERAGKLTALIRDLLRGAPKRFKELYPMIAEHMPEDCPADGNKVSLTSMGWLQEIQRELQEIAINRDGLWHLMETTAARYDREELYEKVWAQPIQTLAKEYGVSNVALAKACKRRGVPLPGVGYWAKKAAGKPVPDRPPLPPGGRTP